METKNEITIEDLREFSQAKTFEQRLKILIIHSEKNKKTIEIRRKNQMEKTNEQIKNEMVELNTQFNEFLHTKGIGAKFKLAFSNMAESARVQHQADVQKFNEEKAKSAEANKDFIEFLHAKGFKAKLMLVIENIKKGAKEASAKTKEQIAKANAQAKHGANSTYTTEELAIEFNKFLKEKGLDTQYTVVITESNN